MITIIITIRRREEEKEEEKKENNKNKNEKKKKKKKKKKKNAFEFATTPCIRPGQWHPAPHPNLNSSPGKKGAKSSKCFSMCRTT